MDKGATDVIPSQRDGVEIELDKGDTEVAAKSGSPDEPEKKADRLELEIEQVRDNLGLLVSEIDHRRHRLNPVVVLRAHPWAAALGGVALIGLVIGGVALRNTRERRRNTLLARTRRLRKALWLLGKKPEKKPQKKPQKKPDRAAADSTHLLLKILTAAATAGAAVVARRLAARLFAPSS